MGCSSTINSLHQEHELCNSLSFYKIKFSRFKKKSYHLLFIILPDIDSFLNNIKNKKFHKTFIESNLTHIAIETSLNHKNAITCVIKISRNKIASADESGFIKLWNLVNGTCILTTKITLHHSEFKPSIDSLLLISKNRIVSGGLANIRIWDITTGICLIRNEIISDGGPYLLKLNQKKFASSSNCGNLVIWDSFTGECLINLLLSTPNWHEVILLNKRQFLSMGKQYIESNNNSKEFLIKIWGINKCDFVHGFLPCFENETERFDNITKLNDYHFAFISKLSKGLWNHWEEIANYQNKVNIFDIKNNNDTLKTIICENTEEVECLIKIDNEQLAVGFNTYFQIINIITEQKMLTVKDSATTFFKFDKNIFANLNLKFKNILNNEKWKFWDVITKKLLFSLPIDKEYNRNYSRNNILKINDYQIVYNINYSTLNIKTIS